MKWYDARREEDGVDGVETRPPKKMSIGSVSSSEFDLEFWVPLVGVVGFA